MRKPISRAVFSFGVILLTVGFVSAGSEGPVPLRTNGFQQPAQLPLTGLASGSFFVPVVLSAVGANNSFFTTELTLTNRGASPATVRYVYTAAAGAGSGSFTDPQVLPAGRQVIVGNVIEFLRSHGLGIADTGSSIGTLSISFTGVAESDVSVTARTTTPVRGPSGDPVGRAGLAYSGLAPDKTLGGTVYLCGLRESDSDRSNIALQNAGDGDVTLRITLVSGDDGTPYEARDVVLPPGGFQQLSVASLAGGARTQQGFFSMIEQTGGTAPYYAYGVINDNSTSDGSFITPRTVSQSGPAGMTLPVVVETSAYSTEVVLNNLSASVKTVRLTVPSSAIPDGTTSIDMVLPAWSQRLIPGFVDYVRSNSPAGTIASGVAYVGPLFVTSPGGDLAGISVSARTSNPSPTGSGSLGLFYTAVPDGGAATGKLLLAGLQQNDQNRTNLALINTGEVDSSPSTFRIEIFDGETGLKAAEKTQEVPARQLVQVNAILADPATGVRNGWIKVIRTAGVNPFLGYVVVNDGAAVGTGTGDGAFVAGENQSTSTGKAITAFAFRKTDNATPVDSHATITATAIKAFLPPGTPVTALKPEFTVSAGATVSVDGLAQTSGVTANDFTSPIAYVVTAEDGTSQTFTVSVVTDIAVFDDAVKAFMSKHAVPGVSIAATHNERLVYVKAYGKQDLEAGTDTTSASLFRLASVSKPITSVAIMRLVEEGKLTLADKVFGAGALLGTQYGSQPYGKWITDITVSHLLHHVAGGWTNDFSDPMFTNPAMTADQLISWTLDNRPLVKQPGTAYAYSNFGYCILGRVIERLMATTYEQAVRILVLQPLGITDMAIGGNTLADRLPNEVKYYGDAFGSAYGMNVHRMDAHGGWIANARDLAKLLVHADGFGNKPDILSASSIAAMTTPSSANKNYACGWAVNFVNNWWHTGGLPGTATEVIRGSNGWNWVILVNTQKPTSSFLGDMDAVLWKALSTLDDEPSYDLFQSD
jgi:D-alanyl-D-alanine carboxypeptidase